MIRFVLMCLEENTTQVRNMRQYPLASLYNAPMTMHSSYAARVQHDLNAKQMAPAGIEICNPAMMKPQNLFFQHSLPLNTAGS